MPPPKTMTTRDASSEVDAAHQFPAAPARITLIAIPLIYAGMGVALGTTAGLALAILGAPTEVSAALDNSTPTVSAATAPATSPVAQPAAAESSPPTAVVQVADKGDGAAHQPGADTARANPAPQPQPQRPHALRTTFVPRARASSNNPLLRPVRVHKHRKRHITDLMHNDLARAPEAVPEQMDGGQQSFGEAPKPSGVYTEGDFTVADYDAKGGTIQSSDGRTFVVGITIASSDANSWGDYRSNVHYRCSQTGSCTLSGPGVVAPNARLI